MSNINPLVLEIIQVEILYICHIVSYIFFMFTILKKKRKTNSGLSKVHKNKEIIQGAYVSALTFVYSEVLYLRFRSESGPFRL